MTDRAILDATYICVGFNIIARIAEALGFDVPPEESFSSSAKLLRVFGYKRLSGFWTRGDSTAAAASFDPYATKVNRLRHAVTSSPASLSAVVRQSITAGRNVSGPLGSYVRKVVEQAHQITDDDIASLYAANYTDDEIFEATVSAALGAGLFRLDCVLRALAEEHKSKASVLHLPPVDVTMPPNQCAEQVAVTG